VSGRPLAYCGESARGRERRAAAKVYGRHAAECPPPLARRFFVFGVGTGEVIKGWDVSILGAEDLPPMKVGGVRRVRIPSALAYGAGGAGCSGGTCAIPPDADLDFEIELVSIR